MAKLFTEGLLLLLISKFSTSMPIGWTKICDDLNLPSFVYNDICFIIKQSKQKFENSKGTCKSMPFGHLATEDPSSPLYDHIKTNYNYAGTSDALWIGIKQTSNQTVTDDWVWMKPSGDEPIPTNSTNGTIWSSGQPDDANGLEQCAAWSYSAPAPGIGDELCSDRYYSVCQLTITGDPDEVLDCTSLPDGMYENPAKTCSRLYYECENGTSYYRSCPLGQGFLWETNSCVNKDEVLACTCGKEYSSQYVPETRSCIYHNSKIGNYLGDKENWHDSFNRCADLARRGWKYGKKLVGRLAHVTTAAMAEKLDAWPSGYLGAEKLDRNHSGLPWYNWFRVSNNPNTGLPVSFVVTSATSGGVDVPSNDFMCLTVNTDDNKWEEKSCYEEGDFFCEEFYNQCENVYCTPPKICVPNVLKDYECMCPPGTAGDNCTLPDVLNPCLLIAGYYSPDTLSCFKKTTSSHDWYSAFAACSNPPFVNFFSRLAHVRNASVWETRLEKDDFWLGHRTLIDESSDMDDWFWFPDRFNPNLKIPHEFQLAPENMLWGDADQDCGFVKEDTDHSEWRDASCYGHSFKATCEHLLDTCTLENVTCPERQECIPDTPFKATCVCISPFTGPNCDQYNMEPLCALRGLSYNGTANPYSCYQPINHYSSSLSHKVIECRNHYEHRHVKTRPAVITNKNVQDYLTQLFASTGKWNAVIGLASDTVVPHQQATWGKPKSTYNYWNPLEPIAPVSYTPPGGVIIKDRPPINAHPYCAYMNFDKETWIVRPCDHSNVKGAQTACEIYVETACDSFPCMHGGVCNAIFPDAYTCSCEYPFYGQNCEKSHMCDTGMSPCQNGATCEPTYPEGYRCFCESPYYGYDCHIYCNTTQWTDWSDCSQSCDYGWEYRSRPDHNATVIEPFIPMAPKDNDFCHPTVKQYKPCNSMQCKTDWTFSGHDQTPYYDKCMSKDGFYTGAGCYFFAESTAPDGIAWDESFGLCETEGAQIGHVYDTHQLLQAISNFLFAKHPPHTKVWLGARGQSFVHWMDSPTTEFTKAIISSSRPPAMTGYYCLARSATELKINHTETNPYLTHGMECNTKDPLDAVRYALCMIPTPFADFNIHKDHYMTGHSSANPISTTAEGPWFCGLQCRYTKGCVSYNYRTSTQSCQMFRAKLGMPEYIDTDGGTDNIYTLNYDTDWSFYNRNY